MKTFNTKKGKKPSCLDSFAGESPIVTMNRERFTNTYKLLLDVLTYGDSRYNGRLAARPLLTQAVTTSVLFATGDITAQQLVEQRGLKAHDLTRTGRMALYGGCEYS